MKNFKVKWLLLSIILSIASINTAWAWDCGWWNQGTGEVKFSINGTEKSLGTVDREKSNYADLELGTVTSSLQIKSAWGKTWGQNCIYSMWLYYRVKVRDASSDAGFSEYQIDFDNNFESNNSYWSKTINTSPDINNLAPGNYEIEYYMQIYLNNDHYAEYHYLNNGGNNYHANFTIPSKNLTVTTSDANGNTVTGSVTGVQKGHAYTIRANAKPGYRLNSWSATSGGSSITIADASSAETTVTFNDFSNNATVTASFVRTYAYIEGRFKIKNEARDAETTTYGSGNWNNEATTIQMTYESANERYSLHTHMTPYELSQNMGTDVQLTPYFYIKSSTSNSSLTNVWAYRPNSGESLQKLTTAGYGNKKAVAPSAVENSLWFASADESGYAVLYFDESHVWYELEQTLTYNGNGNTAGSAPTTTYIERTKSVTAATNPGSLAKSGYVFGGWNEANDGSGTNYTAGSSSITMGSTNKTVYAKWTQTVKLHDNNGDAHSGSVTATYNASSVGSITAPTRDGYSVKGYYAEAEYTNKVMEANGTLVNYTGYVVGGKWQHNAATTLYAKWTENLHDVAVAAGDHGSVSVDEVTNIGVATASGTITATADEGYHFTGWTIPSGVTLASGTTSSESITINAIADSKTITANFAANSYAVKFNANYPSGNRFNNGGSMSNQAFTYDATQYLTANAFACEGYTFAGWATSEDGSVAHTDQKSVSNLTTTNGGTVNLYAVWNDDNKYVFDGNGSESTAWTTAANWTKGAAPSTSSHNVILLKPVVVPANATKEVASVRIATEGEYTPNGGSAITAAGKLTIEPKGMLIVTNAVQNCVITDNAAASAASTTAATLHIESGAAGNGALIWGTSGTPGKAQVDFYTISGGSKGINTSINQYIGTPFSDESNNYNYYNAWTFKVNAAGTAWERLPMGTAMDPFVGYNIIYNGDAGHCFEMEGTLVSNANVGLTATSAVENVLANSWMAPIQIANINPTTDFLNVEATIYIFKSTSEESSSAYYWGNYASYSVNQSGTAVIPSMQSFSVVGGAGGAITLNYNQLVKIGASASSITPNLAPRRDASRRETIWTSQDTLQLFVNGANGWMDELKYFIHEEFSNAFENGWDGHKLYGYSEAPQLYAVTEDGNMAINCVPSVENNVIGFHAGTANNEYTFTFAYSGDEELYLKDTKLNIETLINTEATYTFTSEAEDSDMRFIIIKRAPAVATDAETVSGDRLAVSGVQKIMHNGQLYIIRDGGIYDATGTMVK